MATKVFADRDGKAGVKDLLVFFVLLLPFLASAQDVRENFVRCDTYIDSLGAHRTVSVQWFDGLGAVVRRFGTPHGFRDRRTWH